MGTAVGRDWTYFYKTEVNIEIKDWSASVPACKRRLKSGVATFV